MKEESGKSVFLYDSPNNDTSEGNLVKKPKSRSNEELGPVLSVDSTEGNKKAEEKYGAVHGLIVSSNCNTYI